MSNEISIHKNDIPEYLKCSELYLEIEKGYFVDSENFIKVPSNCLKMTTEIRSLSDFFNLRQTIKYWKVKNLYFDNFFDFIQQNRLKNLDYSNVLFLDYNQNDFRFLKEIQYLVSHNEIKIRELIENNLINLLRYFHIKGYKLERDSCDLAAQNGSLNCLKYAFENGCKWNSDTVLLCGINGNLECLKYSVENGCDIPKNILKDIIDSNTENSFECFKYVHNVKKLKLTDELIRSSVLKNNKNILKYLVENECPKNSNTLCGKFIIERNNELNDNIFNNTDCIDYIYEIDPIYGLGLIKYMKMDNQILLSIKKEDFKKINEVEEFALNNNVVKNDIFSI